MTAQQPTFCKVLKAERWVNKNICLSLRWAFLVPLYGIKKEVFFMNETQLVVKTEPQTLDWLERYDFTNPQHLPNDYCFPVFIVDIKNKMIFGTSTTCMAAAVASGNRPLVFSLEQLKENLSCSI